MTAPGCLFLCLLLLEDCLDHVAGLVYMRQVNLGLNALRGA
jgi:hypothetical protein